MKTNYLISNKYKTPGYVLFFLGITSGVFLFFAEYEYMPLEMPVFAIFNEDGIFGDGGGWFKVITNGVADELASIALIVGGLMAVFSKEKVEDEFIYKLRTDSLVWTIIVNYIVLLFAIIFIYEFTFFHVLVYHMFTPLIFFIIRFNFLKFKLRSHEE